MKMDRETRRTAYDSRLKIEAYRLEGTARPFPNHFHEYYVLGLVEKGQRNLCCKNRDYAIGEGDLLLFHPGDSHGCVQSGGLLDYRGLNIGSDVMRELAEEVTGSREPPRFCQAVLRDPEAARRLRSLHRQVMEENAGSGREELLRLLSLLLRRYGRPAPGTAPDCREEVENACAFMERHLAERISVDQLCRAAGLSRSALLRAFVRAKGVTPYRCLEAIRVGRARQLLEQGATPAEAALSTGFSDQSHFTNCFGRFIGLSPGAYRKVFLEKEEK